MAWTDLTFAYGSLLTSTKMGQLDANLDALAAGDSGAPKVEHAALDADAVEGDNIADTVVASAHMTAAFFSDLMGFSVATVVSTLAAGASWTPGAGLYAIFTFSGSSSALPNAAPIPYCVAMKMEFYHHEMSALGWYCQSHNAGTWVPVLTDGTNFQVTNSDGARPAAVLYKKIYQRS